MTIDLAYAELGLVPGASESEVRTAWRRLASRWHPDRNASPDAVDLMQRINRAYERIRLAAFSGELRNGAPGDSCADGSTHDHEAANAARQSGSQGRTLRRTVRLSLEEAALGCLKVVRGKLTNTCEACSGQGESTPAPCPECSGSGTMRSSAWFGWLSAQASCEACKGSGWLRQACEPCEGKGKRSSTYRRTIRVPAGTRQGDVLHAVAPDDRAGGFDGTLELRVEITAHKLFEADDDGKLRCEMPIDGFAWIAGAWIDVPTLTGLQQMKLQRGRRVYRLRGQGLPLERRGTARGDYLVTVVPMFPESISAEQEALLEQLARASACADEQAAAAPLRAWHRKVHTWGRGRSRREAAGQTG